MDKPLNKGFYSWVAPALAVAAVHTACALWARRRRERRSAASVAAAIEAIGAPLSSARADDDARGAAELEGATAGEPSAVTVASAARRGAVSTTWSRLAAVAPGSFCAAVYYFYVPVSLTWFSTACVNSATHLWGDAPFEDAMMTQCRSHNVAFLFFPLLGENWHNNHHAMPGAASTWVQWYQARRLCRCRRRRRHRSRSPPRFSACAAAALPPAGPSAARGLPQVDFVLITLRVAELFGLVSEVRVETPTLLRDGAPPPTGFPLVLWSLWLAIFTSVYLLRGGSVPFLASSAVPKAKRGE